MTQVDHGERSALSPTMSIGDKMSIFLPVIFRFTYYERLLLTQSAVEETTGNNDVIS